jgi:hypothetical protein
MSIYATIQYNCDVRMNGDTKPNSTKFVLFFHIKCYVLLSTKYCTYYYDGHLVAYRNDCVYIIKVNSTSTSL